MKAMPDEQIIAETTFACSICGETAGTIQLYGPDDRAKLMRSSFTSRLTCPIEQESFEHVRGAIDATNFRALYDYQPEIPSFFCPQCNVCYCKSHWTSWDVFEEDDGIVWHDSIRGRCPKGHERILED